MIRLLLVIQRLGQANHRRRFRFAAQDAACHLAHPCRERVPADKVIEAVAVISAVPKALVP
jgi:hypothetical protein